MGEAVREELSRVGTPCRCKLAPRWQGGVGDLAVGEGQHSSAGVFVDVSELNFLTFLYK